MKTLVVILAFAAMAFCLGRGPPAAASEPLPYVPSTRAIVVDRDTGLLLGQKQPDNPTRSASTTKILTALFSLEVARLPETHPSYRSLNSTVTISSHAAGITGSRAGFRPGDQISFLELFYCMMLPSGNDAAVAMAEHVAGSDTFFVELMNIRASQLGLSNTHYVTPYGGPIDDQYTTVHDLAILSRIALRDPVFAAIVSIPTYTTATWVDSLGNLRTSWMDPVPNPPVIRSNQLRNSNQLLRNEPYPGANGVKTGTSPPITNLVASVGPPGKSLVTVVMNAGDRYVESHVLLNWGFPQLFKHLKPTSMAAGYFNDDDYEDLAIGVPYECHDAQLAAGKVYIYMGSPTGLSLTQPRLFTQNSAGVSGQAENGDYFGFALATGDFDNNGRDDLAIGVPFEDIDDLVDAGAIHIIYSDDNGLNPAFKEQIFAQSNQGDGDLFDASARDDRFGFSLAAGNFDGSNGDDLAIGAPGEDIADPSAIDGGVVHIIYSEGGRDAGLNPAFLQHMFHQSDPPVVPNAAETGDQFGYSLAAGDFDGNARDDLAVGAPFENLGTAIDAGHVGVIYGTAGGLDPTFRVTELHQNIAGMPGTAQDHDWFGYALVAGDFFYNSRVDLAIGAPGETVGAQNTRGGVVDVVYSDQFGLNPLFPARPAQQFIQGANGLPDSNEDGDNFGAALAVGPFTVFLGIDIKTGDPVYGARPYLAIGTPGEDFEGTKTKLDAGATTVLYFDGTNGPSDIDHLVPPNPVGQTMASGPGEHFGRILAAGRFRGGTNASLAWAPWGSHWDGTRLRSGYTLITPSTNWLDGLAPAATTNVDLWLRDCCDNDPRPLNLDNHTAGSISNIWNVLGDERVNRFWRHEGFDPIVPLPSLDFPDGFSLSLERTLCSDHFKFYYTQTSGGGHNVSQDYVVQVARLLEDAWDALCNVQDFRSPLQTMWEGRYREYEAFRRIPVLIFDTPDGVNHARSTPAIYLKTDLSTNSPMPIHQFFHVLHAGYTYYREPWLRGGAARWSRRFQFGGDPASVCDIGYTNFMPLTFSITSDDRGSCEVAPWFEYLARKYSPVSNQSDPGSRMNGSDVLHAILNAMKPIPSNGLETDAMLAIEEGLDTMDTIRDTGFGQAYFEWASANYVDDRHGPDLLRPETPWQPRYLLGGKTARGGNEYFWRAFSIETPATDTITIQVRAQADSGGAGDDDDLRFRLDGELLGDWNSANAFDGDSLLGKIKTIHIVPPYVGAGNHSLHLEADQTPTLHSLEVFSGELPLLFQISPDAQPASFTDEEIFLSCNFDVPPGVSNITIQLIGQARNNSQNQADGYPADDDDARMLLNGTPLTPWNAEGTLNGRFLDGETALTEIRVEGLTPSSPTLDIQVDGRPFIREVTVFPTPPSQPVLQVRVHNLPRWTATYHVVPVTQVLIDSQNSLQIQFQGSGWIDGIAHPFEELMQVRASNGGLLGTRDRTRGLANTRTINNSTLADLGHGGRIVHLVADAAWGGVSEVVTKVISNPNESPILLPLADWIMTAGQTVSFNASATDPDMPPQRLTYSLDDRPPTGAWIDPVTGAFRWTPSDAQSPSTNVIMIRVTDDGTPPLSTVGSFTVTVSARPKLAQLSFNEGQITFAWEAVPGQGYRVQSTGTLTEPDWRDWPGGIRFENGLAIFEADLGSQAERYFRVLVP